MSEHYANFTYSLSQICRANGNVSEILDSSLVRTIVLYTQTANKITHGAELEKSGLEHMDKSLAQTGESGKLIDTIIKKYLLQEIRGCINRL